MVFQVATASAITTIILPKDKKAATKTTNTCKYLGILPGIMKNSVLLPGY
jgi:hypothetical protein